MNSRSGADGTIVIVGGGPAGLAAGITLARLGIRPIVIDRRDRADPARPKIGESLAPRAWPVLQRLGIDHLVDANRHLPSPGTVSAWGHSGLASEDFLFQPGCMGWHLDRNRFEADLRQFAKDSGVRVVESSAKRFERIETSHWRVELESAGEVIEGSFLIDASGRTSAVALSLGIRRQVFDRLAAWYAFLDSPGPIEDTRAMVEAIPDGWWYSALLPRGKLVVAKFCDPAALAGRNRSLREWLGSLAATTWTRQRIDEVRYRAASDPRVASADTSIAAILGGAGWTACGDAAASYDPLSSHGIATALASGMDAAQAAFAAIGGDREPLDRYMDRVRRSFTYCLEMRARVYDQEKRWSESPFWSARSSLDIRELDS